MIKLIVAALLAAPRHVLPACLGTYQRILGCAAVAAWWAGSAEGPYHLELIAKDGALVLHVTDHAWKEIHTEGGEGKATIQQGKDGSKLTVKLEPSQQNMLMGHGEFQVNPETVIVVFVKLPEQEAYGAKINPAETKVCRGGKEGN